MTRTGFDNERYLAEQTAAIQQRVRDCGGRLYLEFGGKLLVDYHAARVLPGFDPNGKMRLLQQLGDDVEVLLCIYAGDPKNPPIAPPRLQRFSAASSFALSVSISL